MPGSRKGNKCCSACLHMWRSVSVATAPLVDVCILGGGGCVGFRYTQSFGMMRPFFRVAPTLALYLLVEWFSRVCSSMGKGLFSIFFFFFLNFDVSVDSMHDLVYHSMSLMCQVCRPFWVNRDQLVSFRKGSLCSVLVYPSVRTHTPDHIVSAVMDGTF